MDNSVFRIIFLCITIMLLLSACSFHKNKDAEVNLNCDSVSSCVSEIDRLTYSKWGISKTALNLAERIASFGDDALPSLMELIKSENLMDQKVAGYALANYKEIDSKYLGQIIEGVKRDVDWLAAALGSIKTQEAAEISLQMYLSDSSSPDNQKLSALIKNEQLVLPLIIKSGKCGTECTKNQSYLLSQALKEMSDASKTEAAKSIMAELESENTNIESKHSLIPLLFDLRSEGRVIEDRLFELRKNFADLAPAIDYAFIGIKSKYSGQVFAKILREVPSIRALRDVAEIGPPASDAGPELINLLSHSDPDIRLGAARALGYLQYKPAVDFLIPLLAQSDDIRLNWVAAKSLGMIGEPIALSALKKIASDHWYPTVREAASSAIHMIENSQPHQSQFHENNFAFDFFSYQHMSALSCEIMPLKTVKEDPELKLYRSTHEQALEALSYESVILSYGAIDEAEQQAEDPDGIIEVNQYNMVEHREIIQQVPGKALKVDGGWLAGSDRGEWGGELMYLPHGGEPQKLGDTNVEDIYKLGERYIALTGLAHLGANFGSILELKRDGNTWSAEFWKSLPGAPGRSWFVETGELYIDTYGGGSILLTTEGNFRMAPCDQYAEDN